MNGNSLPPMSLWRTTPPAAPQRSIEEIGRTMAAVRGVSFSLVLADDRSKRVASARLAIYAACRDAGYTTTAIGQALGRDHSTVAVGSRRHWRERAQRMAAE